MKQSDFSSTSKIVMDAISNSREARKDKLSIKLAGTVGHALAQLGAYFQSEPIFPGAKNMREDFTGEKETWMC